MERQSAQDFQDQMLRLAELAIVPIQQWLDCCAALMQTGSQAMMESYEYYTCALRLYEEEAPEQTRTIEQAAE